MLRTHPRGRGGSLSRRRLLQLSGAAVLAPLLLGCRLGSPRPTKDTLRAFGEVLRNQLGRGPASSLPSSLVDRLTDQAEAQRILASRAEASRGDFARGHTVEVQGWLLSRSDAAVLIAYADS